MTGDERQEAVEPPIRPEARLPAAAPATRPRPVTGSPGTAETTGAGTLGGKHNVLGVYVDALDYDATIGKVLAAAREPRPFTVTALAVHGVMTGVRDRAYNARLNAIDVVAPDGQPVRWALNLLYGTRLRDWVSGPELALRVVGRMAEERLPVYLYGTTPRTLDRLRAALTRRFPRLRIAGTEPSKFRPAEPGEEEAIADRIHESGARLVLVGLGCPRQEVFIHAMRPLVRAPLLAVGAAFDYHAGLLRPAPPWMQRQGLAWLWRLGAEPRRLWRRYLVPNVEYLGRLAAQRAGWWRPDPPPATDRRAEFIPV